VNLSEPKNWWKNPPFNEEIPSGIYFIPKSEISNIKLITNNKSDHIIHPKDLYKMLLLSIKNNLFINAKINNKKYKKLILDYTFVTDDDDGQTRDELMKQNRQLIKENRNLMVMVKKLTLLSK
jgi:hypothetical protein